MSAKKAKDGKKGKGGRKPKKDEKFEPGEDDGRIWRGGHPPQSFPFPGHPYTANYQELLEFRKERAALRVECLQEAYMRRKSASEWAHAEEQELREKRDQLRTDYQNLKDERYDIISDFTRQNKSMQDELIVRINDLESTICDLKDQLELSKIALEEIKNDKDQQIKQKDKEINEQSDKMDDMAREFEMMLHDTLEKMSERIDEKKKDDHADGGDDAGDEEEGHADGEAADGSPEAEAEAAPAPVPEEEPAAPAAAPAAPAAAAAEAGQADAQL
eukprot:TRINITY_DN8751_c3_g1_i1.p1 TRINITY_DN8751_c3_g1~~TRINITY_DN8751_c3_g1_i1.p1  ORF type:complete len:274 (+),score=111.01 TRINITY_DN8751_c3_g1_i1:64-885(+)